MDVRSIAVLGAGHGGCAAAADLGKRGYSVRLHARNAERLAPLRVQGGIEARGIHQGLVPIDLLSTDVAEAVRGADLIMLVVPSVAHEHYARELAPLLDGNQPIFINPGHTGGGLHFRHELRKAGYRRPLRSCETVTLTYITRMEGPAVVNIYSYTKRLRFAALPAKEAASLLALVKPLYPEIVPASSVLETALSNMNAIFHPEGMIMNAGWIQHTGGNFLFYREGLGRTGDAVPRRVLRGRADHQGRARQRRHLARLPRERAEQDHQVAVLARPPLHARGRRLRPGADCRAWRACGRQDADHRCAGAACQPRRRDRLCSRRPDPRAARRRRKISR
jgi:uncharacterized membrane protein